MCMATAYLRQGSGRERVLEEVAYLQLDGGTVLLKPLLGEQKRVRATIREIDFLSSTILLEPAE